jgi:nucleotide-binding universal stress UspA family protein
MFKKILVATDLGEVSAQALASATQMAREHDSTLVVVNVIPDPLNQPWATEAYGIDWSEVVENMRSAARGELKRVVSGITPPLAAIETEVLVGAPATEIVRYASERGVDVIVLGTHGRGPVRRAFLGSVAERVVREAPCPVLIVRPAAPAVTQVHAA